MVHRRANQPKEAPKIPGVCKLAPKCKKKEATRWRPVPGGGECCGGNACMIFLGLKKEKKEYAAARLIREGLELAAAQGEASEADDSSSSSPSPPASPQPEEENDGPPVADPPAPMPEAPPAEEPAPAAVDEQAAEPASPSQLRLIHTGETRREVYDEGYENGRQAGRDRADLDRLLVIKMLQHQLVRCTEHLEQANRWLKISHMGCVDYGIHGEFEGSDHDEHIKTLCSENEVLADLWHTMSTEGYEDLAIRNRAWRAQHGR